MPALSSGFSSAHSAFWRCPAFATPAASLQRDDLGRLVLLAPADEPLEVGGRALGRRGCYCGDRRINNVGAEADAQAPDAVLDALIKCWPSAVSIGAGRPAALAVDVPHDAVVVGLSAVADGLRGDSCHAWKALDCSHEGLAGLGLHVAQASSRLTDRQLRSLFLFVAIFFTRYFLNREETSSEKKDYCCSLRELFRGTLFIA